MQGVSIQDIKKSVHDWNVRFPIDRWWREKHGIPFGSKDHLDANFIDMIFEFTEDELVAEYGNEPQVKGSEYTAGRGDFLKESIMSDSDIDEMFDSIKLG